MKLQLGNAFSIPLEAVTQTFAILAKRGVGKTYTALVLAEELLRAKMQVVIADPVGVCWGLRAAANGKDPGLAIIVLGGEHGDAPLEAGSGKVIAEFVVDTKASVVLDMSLLRKGEQVRFMTDFCETLYHRNRTPLHLIMDEADAFAPQRVFHGTERMLGAVQDLVRRGRARGIGVTLVTQRAAVLNKDVLTQVEVLVALRTIAPQDREAMDAWIQAHDAHGQRMEFMESLASLPIGTAWFWSPGWLDVFQRVEIRKRTTFDSSATPKVGQPVKSPKQLAPVDLDVLKTSIAATIERAKADDPVELRKEISRLKAELKKPSPAPAALAEKVKRVEIPILKDAQIKRLESLLTKISAEAERHGKAMAVFWHNLDEVASALLAVVKSAAATRQRPNLTVVQTPTFFSDGVSLSRTESRKPIARSEVSHDKNSDKLSSGERKILTVLAHYPEGCTKVRVAVLTGYAHSGGGYQNHLSALRSKGCIVGSDRLRLTDAGAQAIGPVDPLPTGSALRDYWLQRLPKAERLVLELLHSVYPEAVTKEDVAAKTGYAASGGGFQNALSRLRTLELIQGRDELKASAVFFE